MKKQLCVLLQLDVRNAIQELAQKFNLSLGEVVEFMYHELGGKDGIEKRLRDRLLGKPLQVQTQAVNTTTLTDAQLWAIFDYLSEHRIEREGW